MRIVGTSLLLLPLILLPCAVSAWAEDAPPTGRRAVTLKDPATTYHLYVPEAYAEGAEDATWPLVVALHPARTPAQANLDWYGPEARQRGWFILAPKARGERWAASDSDIVLAALADVQATYRIDPLKICLAGYSSGAGMATSWGVQEHARWRCLFAHAGVAFGTGLADAKDSLRVLLSVGDQDRAAKPVRAAHRSLVKAGFDAELEVYPGMDHFRTTPEVWARAFDFFETKLALPAERLLRATRAREQKRWRAAADEIRHLLAEVEDPKQKKAVAKEQARLVKEGRKLVRDAARRAKKEPEATLTTLRRLAAIFDGWAPAEDAAKHIAKLQAR